MAMRTCHIKSLKALITLRQPRELARRQTSGMVSYIRDADMAASSMEVDIERHDAQVPTRCTRNTKNETCKAIAFVPLVREQPTTKESRDWNGYLPPHCLKDFENPGAEVAYMRAKNVAMSTARAGRFMRKELYCALVWSGKVVGLDNCFGGYGIKEGYEEWRGRTMEMLTSLWLTLGDKTVIRACLCNDLPPKPEGRKARSGAVLVRNNRTKNEEPVCGGVVHSLHVNNDITVPPRLVWVIPELEGGLQYHQVTAAFSMVNDFVAVVTRHSSGIFQSLKSLPHTARSMILTQEYSEASAGSLLRMGFRAALDRGCEKDGEAQHGVDGAAGETTIFDRLYFSEQRGGGYG
ncbi:hypothetical protein EDB85DRAFT_1885455 [Lactarius pseudohatsudake]|nr:hypothetical protein EDB85DRAFT_1885455 [Lactarius pseudohatsudake]